MTLHGTLSLHYTLTIVHHSNVSLVSLLRWNG